MLSDLLDRLIVRNSRCDPYNPTFRIGGDEDDSDDDADDTPAPGATAGAQDSELPRELRMDDYDDEPGLTLTGNGDESDDGLGDEMEDDDDEEEGEEDDKEEKDDDDDGEAMGISFVEEPATGQVNFLNIYIYIFQKMLVSCGRHSLSEDEYYY